MDGWQASRDLALVVTILLRHWQSKIWIQIEECTPLFFHFSRLAENCFNISLEDESTKVYFTSFDGRDDKWGAARPTWEQSSCEEKLLGNRGLNHQLKVGSLGTRGCKFIILERKNAFLRGMRLSSLVLVVDIARGRKKGDTKFTLLDLFSKPRSYQISWTLQNRTQKKVPQYSGRDVGGKVPACRLEGICEKLPNISAGGISHRYLDTINLMAWIFFLLLLSYGDLANPAIQR